MPLCCELVERVVQIAIPEPLTTRRLVPIIRTNYGRLEVRWCPFCGERLYATPAGMLTTEGQPREVPASSGPRQAGAWTPLGMSYDGWVARSTALGALVAIVRTSGQWQALDLEMVQRKDPEKINRDGAWRHGEARDSQNGRERADAWLSAQGWELERGDDEISASTSADVARPPTSAA